MEHFYRDIYPDYFSYPKLYRSFVEEAKEGSLLVEVGAFLGRSIAYLGVEALNSGKNLRIDCIDDWNPASCRVWYTDADGKNFREYAGVEVYKQFLRNMEPLGNLVRSMRMTSLEAVDLYEDESIDYLFLNGDQSYETVRDELHAWYPKIKPGGIIAGHDWNGFPGVQRAVRGFAKFDSSKVRTSENCWIYRKPDLPVNIFETEESGERNFDAIYERGLWGWEGNGSGTGSMMHTTVAVRDLFCKLIEEEGVSTIVDVSVGGMLWWPEVLEKYPHVKFYGYDISKTKTAENAEKYRDRVNWKFDVADVTTKMDYPKCDLLICRHTLNHLSAQDVIKSMVHLKVADARLLGITQHEVDDLFKEELITPDAPGCVDYRPIDLRRSPIAMPDPWLEIEDADAEDVQMEWQRKFCIWQRLQ